jgi:hypothetical protein
MFLGMCMTVFNCRQGSITKEESVLPLAGFGLFAAGSIIAVIGRLTRHRWWGNRDWKEDSRHRDPAQHWWRIMLDCVMLILVAKISGASIPLLIVAAGAGLVVGLALRKYRRIKDRHAVAQPKGARED